MNVQTKPLNDITQQALALLTKELGIANTMRFSTSFHPGMGTILWNGTRCLQI